jgi:Tfp pilus assembly protein PilO
MKITEREMILGIATLACVLLGGTWAGVNGKIAEWKAKKTEIVRLRQQILQHKNVISMQSSWAGDLQELEKDLRVFDTIQRSVSSDLMKTIKTISNTHDLEITKTSPQNEKPTDNLFEMGINCTWQGKLDAVVDFLTDLQQQEVRYNIRSLTITPVGKNSGKLKGNMVIDCAYTRKDGVYGNND